MKFIHLLLSNLIGQNVQAMVQFIFSHPILQSDWSEVTSHGTNSYRDNKIQTSNRMVLLNF